jgi:hypothetical protein
LQAGFSLNVQKQMSTQSFKNAFREALWEVHGKKCFYCGRELLLRDVQIDHIIPEYLEKDPQARAETFATIGLDDDFKITGRENLAPSCGQCNADKGGATLHPGSIAIQLSKIRGKLPQLDEALRRQRSERNLEDTLREATRSIERGNFSARDLISRLMAAYKITDDAFAEALAPPVSTKVRIKFHDQTKPGRLFFTTHALESMSNRGFSFADVNTALFEGIKTTTKTPITADPKRPDRFIIRGQNNLRVTYAVSDDKIKVLTVSWDK